MYFFTTFTASTYVDLIEELELMYGGLNRCFNFVRTKLINGSKLKLNHMTNMHDVRGRIENFIEHCHMHGLSKDINNKLMLQLVHCKVMLPDQLSLLYQENEIKPFSAKMDTIFIIVEWLTRKITAIRYAQERSTKVFDPVVEIKKVNLALAEANVGQEMAPENLVEDFSSTALVTQLIDVKAEFQDEYEQGHPDNYNLEDVVKDDSDSDTERLKGNVMYYRIREKASQRQPERKTQVVPPCLLFLSKGENSLHWLTKCKAFIKQEVNKRQKTFRLLDLCKNCFLRDHKTKECAILLKCKVKGCDDKHHSLLHMKLAEKRIAQVVEDNVRHSLLSARL
jgi:hypothetical protein